MSEIQQNRWDQLLRRAGGLIGPGSKVNDALTELFPTIEVERVTAENLKPAGWATAWGSSSLTAAAGEFPGAQLLNPAGSGNLIVCEQVVVMPIGGTQNFRLELGTAVFTSFTNSQRFRDSRNGLLPNPVGQMRAQSLVGAVSTILEIRVLANTQFKVSDENAVAVLSPGFSLDVGTGSAAGNMVVSFLWRERPALESELNF